MAKVLTEEEVNAVSLKYPLGSSSYTANRCCTGLQAIALGCDILDPFPCQSNQLVTTVVKHLESVNSRVVLLTTIPKYLSYSFIYSGTTYSGTIEANAWFLDPVSLGESSKINWANTSCLLTTTEVATLTSFTMNGSNKGTLYAYYDSDSQNHRVLLPTWS